jgi:hypothetical protein
MKVTVTWDETGRHVHVEGCTDEQAILMLELAKLDVHHDMMIQEQLNADKSGAQPTRLAA